MGSCPPQFIFYAAEVKNGWDAEFWPHGPCVPISRWQKGSANLPLSQRGMTGTNGQERLWKRGAEPAVPGSGSQAWGGRWAMLPASPRPCAWQGCAEPGPEAPIPQSPMGKSQAGLPRRDFPPRGRSRRGRGCAEPPLPPAGSGNLAAHMWHMWHYVRSGCCRPWAMAIGDGKPSFPALESVTSNGNWHHLNAGYLPCDDYAVLL